MAKPVTSNLRPSKVTATATGGVTLQPAALLEKVTNTLLMVAVERDGVEFNVNGSTLTFFVPNTHGNYAAMVSMLIAAQGNGAMIAVKYPKFTAAANDRREPTAIARGVHAIISGGTF